MSLPRDARADAHVSRPPGPGDPVTAPIARSRPRVAVIGLDAAEWSLIEPMLASGELPRLARLRQTGTFCRLRQTTPLTEQPWASFLSGVPAAVNAIQFEAPTYATFEVGAPRVPPFYARLPG